MPGEETGRVGSDLYVGSFEDGGDIVFTFPRTPSKEVIERIHTANKNIGDEYDYEISCKVINGNSVIPCEDAGQ